MEHAIYLTTEEAAAIAACVGQVVDDGRELPALDKLRDLRYMITHVKNVLGSKPRVVYPDYDTHILTDLDLPQCTHEHQRADDRYQAICNDCNEELGR